MNDLSYIKEGELWTLHCRRDSFLSKAIRKVTGGDISHTSFAYRKGENILVFDAQRIGCYPRMFEYWNAKFGYSFEAIKVDKIGREYLVTLDDVILVMRDYYGKPYGWKDLFKHLAYKYTHIWLTNGNEENDVTCGELVMTILKRVGIYKGENANKMNPQQVYEWALKQN